MLLSIKEIFAGLPRQTEEVVVEVDGPTLQTGKTYLIDAARDGHNDLRSILGGRTGEIASPSSVEFLDYLRKRAAGLTPTSLTVHVQDYYTSLEGADVTIVGPRGTLRSRTVADGTAKFEKLILGGIYSRRFDRELPA